MTPKIIREVVQIDGNRQIYINVPSDMGELVEVILMQVYSPEGPGSLSDEDCFKLSAYAEVVDEDVDEDFLWETYTHG